MTNERAETHESDPNIFADIGLPDAREHFLKAQIVAELFILAREQKLTQMQTGEKLGISQPEVSRLFKGNFREYSVERLMKFLTLFNHDIDIILRSHDADDGPGQITFHRENA